MLASVTEDLGQPARDAEIKHDVERDREFRVRRRNRGIETGAAVARDIEAGAWDRSNLNGRIDLVMSAYGLTWPIVGGCGQRALWSHYARIRMNAPTLPSRSIPEPCSCPSINCGAAPGPRSSRRSATNSAMRGSSTSWASS